MTVINGKQTLRVADEDKPGGQKRSGASPIAISTVEPFAIYSTGAGLDRGAADSHWEIADIGDEASFKPRPALVMTPSESLLHDDRNHAQWVSAATDAQVGEAKGPLHLPRTVRFDGLRSGNRADFGRYCRERLARGVANQRRSLPLSEAIRHTSTRNAPIGVNIENSFQQGVNVLDIVIESTDASAKSGGPALYVDWFGKAHKEDRHGA